jgi:murein DD-endopeptidase MepM/ murein hydrolase activator NlpD
MHITFIPGHHGRTVNVILPGWAFNLVLGTVIAAIVMLVGGVLVTARMGLELRELRSLRVENELLKADHQKVRQLEAELAQLETFRQRVLALTNEDAERKAGAGTSGAPTRDTRLPSAIIAEQARAQYKGGRSQSSVGESAGSALALGPGAGDDASLLLRKAKAAGRTPVGPPMAWRWPVEGVVSKGFQTSKVPGKEHHGLDIAAAHGSPVVAARGGLVSFAGQDSVFGRLVIIDHGSGVESLYGHNSTLRVGAGDMVSSGQEIARVGSTGESSAPHLHFEIRENGQPVDPRRLLP